MKTTSLSLALFLAVATGASAARTWIHPGALDGKAELDYVKKQIATGAQPWTGILASMKNLEKLTAAPTPETSIDANNGSENSKVNSRSAYGNALAWYLTGDETYAKQAIAILNAWTILNSITAKDQQNLLQGGWIGALFGPAAEIMLGYPGWDPQDIAKVRAMFKRAFYPVLNTASTWNGNVDLTQIDAMMSIAVFNEDETEFDLGLDRLKTRVPGYFYLTSDPKPNSGWWSNPTKWVDGLTQETCRDNNHHAQFAMSAAFGAAEVAWHQGVDVYTTYQQRFVAAEELMALQSYTKDMQGTCGGNASTDIYNTWEIGYNHYHTRKQIAMPNSWKMISEKSRKVGENMLGPGSWNIFYETLTHADIVYDNSGIVRPSNKPGQIPANITLTQDGFCQIQSSSNQHFEIMVHSLDGREINRVQAQTSLGETKLVPLGIHRAPAGIYLVQVRSGLQTTVLKYFK